ncbi:MAG: hypothetical protein SOZ28_03345 [Clostridia bacterium]|nr:hypothetical protein [Clostridia bacterium]
MKNIWWKQVTTANAYIKKVVENISNKKSMALEMPECVPWKEYFDECIESAMKSRSSESTIDFICSPGEKIGDYILNKYCSEEKRATYRPDKTFACFLAQSDDIVLNNRIVWVKNIPDNMIDEWLEFVSDYSKNVKKDRPHAVFILEIPPCRNINTKKKGIINIVYTNELSIFDTYVFCTLAVSDIKINRELKRYLAELVSSICGYDIELCSICIERYNEFLSNPIDTVMNNIINTVCRSNGDKFEVVHSEDEMHQLIWSSQLKIIFPVIEEYRRKFVIKYKNQINSHLPITTTYNECFTEPEDVEIGTLMYMAADDKIHCSEEDRHKLFDFKEARNLLAHLKILPFDKVEHLLSDSIY